MHGNQLALQMSGELSQMESVRGQCIEHFITIGLAFRGELQIKQAAIPGWDLHALVAQTARPVRDILQIVERSHVTGKLGQKNCRTLDGFHDHREFALPNIRQLIYTSLKMNVGASIRTPDWNTWPGPSQPARARTLAPTHSTALCEWAGWARLVSIPICVPATGSKGVLHARQPACTHCSLITHLV